MHKEKEGGRKDTSIQVSVYYNLIYKDHGHTWKSQKTPIHVEQYTVLVIIITAVVTVLCQCA